MMWLDGRFQAQLQRAGMARFEAVMEHRGGLCLRVLDDRENWYFAPQGDSAAVGVYLKKHRVRTWSSLLRAKLRAGLRRLARPRRSPLRRLAPCAGHRRDAAGGLRRAAPRRRHASNRSC